MESVPAVFPSTRESTNYARLCHLLTDVGCTVLCDTFDSIHPPVNLHKVLSNPSVFSTLQSLSKERVFHPFQWAKLFPSDASTVSSANFDIALLVVLLKNICDLSPPSSTGSWDKLPPDSDKSTEANIVRIKCYRDDVYGHVTKASVDDATFNALWEKTKSTILALASGTNYSALYETDISQLKDAECMDRYAEAYYKRLLTDWKKDDTLKEVHVELKGMLIDLYMGSHRKVCCSENVVNLLLYFKKMKYKLPQGLSVEISRPLLGALWNLMYFHL